MLIQDETLLDINVKVQIEWWSSFCNEEEKVGSKGDN